MIRRFNGLEPAVPLSAHLGRSRLPSILPVAGVRNRAGRTAAVDPYCETSFSYPKGERGRPDLQIVDEESYAANRGDYEEKEIAPISRWAGEALLVSID